MEQILEGQKKYNEYWDHQSSCNNWTGYFFEIEFFMNIIRGVINVIQAKYNKSKKSSGEEFEGDKSQGKLLFMMSGAPP